MYIICCNLILILNKIILGLFLFFLSLWYGVYRVAYQVWWLRMTRTVHSFGSLVDAVQYYVVFLYKVGQAYTAVRAHIYVASIAPVFTDTGLTDACGFSKVVLTAESHSHHRYLFTKLLIAVSVVRPYCACAFSVSNSSGWKALSPDIALLLHGHGPIKFPITIIPTTWLAH